MNKKKITLSIVAILIIFIAVERISSKKAIIQQEEVKKTIEVSTQKVSDSKKVTQKIEYPASVVGDQEVRITSKSGGTVMTEPGNIGSAISAGAVLAKIDDFGTLGAGNEGLGSLQVRQTEIAFKQAKESYDLAKKNYDDLKSSNSATDLEIRSAKSQRESARLQYENVKISLIGTVDNHLITSPITGIITAKAVSVGDSVSAGQLLATVSKSANVKIQFFVDASQQPDFKRGQEISAVDGSGKSFQMIVKNISISADQATKRFLIEAYPKKQGQTNLLAGTILTVTFEKEVIPQTEGNIILPLSAISVGQNESYIFKVENGVAKKELVTIAKVSGENAEITTRLSDDSQIIIVGNRLVRDGEKVLAQN